MARQKATEAKIPTRERLARVIEKLSDPRMQSLADRARKGEFDDYLSPHTDNIGQLVRELTDLAHREPDLAPRLQKLIGRAVNGDFDATKAEGEAWMRSPEGRAVTRELLGS